MDRRRLRIPVLSICVALAATPIVADDSDIFTAQAVQPNVIILIDTSGSMNSEIGGTPKIDTAKSVVTTLVQTVQGVRFGIFSFNSSATGAKLVSPVGASVSSMVTAISNLNASGMTPLGRSAQDIQNYFKGTFVSGGVTQPSPIQYECQKNYLILMTDGLPTGEDTDLVKNVATSLFTTDHATSLSNLQNVVVSTIGFNIPDGAALLTATAANGGGTFYTANNATELANSLQSALSNIVVDAYSFTPPLIPTTSVGGANRAYFAAFQPDPARPFWRGTLSAYTRNSSGLITVGTDGQPDPATRVWEAGALLAAKAPSSRTIYTAVSGTREDFIKTNADITPTLLGLTTNGERDALVDFLRGIDTYDEDADGNSTENRAWKLGDIYHSSPVLVAAPPLKSSDSSYATFRQANLSRTPILLAGANDGMLHAFRESDGQELWAFIPPAVLASLKALKPSNGAGHPFFVDGSPVVADIKIGTTWKTIVLFGLRRGGRTYTALDITDTTAPAWLWSFTDTAMGETWSEPAVGQIKLTGGTVKDVAFFGGGYNSTSNNATGKAVFAVDLSNGAKLWQYVTGTSDAGFLNFSVAAPPAAVDLDGNGYLDRVYVGDVGGQMWKFDVSAPGSLSGSLVSNWTGKRLFLASPTQSNPPPSGTYLPAQAIYNRPALAYDQQGDLWIFFGTGDRDHPNSTSSNRLYGIKENTDMSQASALTEASLVDASLTVTTIGQGWYRALSSREKALSNPQVYDKVAYFSTYTSNLTASCSNPSGTAKLYAMQIDRGDAAFDWTTNANTPGENSNAVSETIGSGIPSQPQIVLGSPNDSIVDSTTEGEIDNNSRPTATSKHLRYWKETY